MPVERKLGDRASFSPRYNAKHRRGISIRIRCSYLAAATALRCTEARVARRESVITTATSSTKMNTFACTGGNDSSRSPSRWLAACSLPVLRLFPLFFLDPAGDSWSSHQRFLVSRTLTVLEGGYIRMYIQGVNIYLMENSFWRVDPRS